MRSTRATQNEGWLLFRLPVIARAQFPSRSVLNTIGLTRELGGNVRVSRRLVNPTRWMALAGNWKAPLTLAADSGRMTGYPEVMHLSANGNCALGVGKPCGFSAQDPLRGRRTRLLVPK
jgi:hypothetical protein